jgi:hypothetical protein
VALGLPLGMNKGGGLRIALTPRRRSSLCMSFWFWLEVEFWKASPMNVTVYLMLGVRWIGRYSVVRTHDFISTVWF